MSQQEPEHKSDFPSLKAPGVGPKISSIFDFSAEALGELMTYIAQNPPAIPISQIIGFAGFMFQPATTILTSETTSSTTFVDLATVGPSLTLLPDGKYAIFYGSQSGGSGGAAAIMSVQVNSTAAIDDDSTVDISGNSTPTRLILKTLSNGGSNSLTAKYRTSNAANVAGFLRRWMIVAKYSNA